MSSLYGQFMTLRNSLYDRGILHSESAKLPTIVVGNLTVGGNGKSPVSEEICRSLPGYRPVILLRGYGGRVATPHLVTTEDSAREVGDEALMHFRAGFTVVVSPNRPRGCRYIEENDLGDLVVLDDGLQHRALRPTVSLALFDQGALNDVALQRYLPFGRLREPVLPALNRISAVVLVERGERLSRPHWLPESFPCFSIALALSGLRELGGGSVQFSDIGSALALSSLAKPEQFEQMLQQSGVKIHHSIRGKDHQQWSNDDLEALDNLPGEVVITTEKDAVKLEGLSLPTKKIYVATLRAELPDKFLTWIIGQL